MLAALLLGGCVTPPEDPEERAAFEETNDSFEPTNRAVFDANLALDRAVLKPFAKGYRTVLPETMQNNTRNFLRNVRSPLIFINDVLQGKPGRASETFMRFFVNSTAGMLGLFDVAGQLGLEYHDEDFGQTLAVWGFGEGQYVMLPLFGPSNVRDTVGRVADTFLDPFTHVVAATDQEFAALGATFTRGIDERSRNIETLDEIERTSVDFYAAIRSLYRQRRADEISDGEATALVPAPSISYDFLDEFIEEPPPDITEDTEGQEPLPDITEDGKGEAAAQKVSLAQ
ncbi:MAG: VacJ family lipoprotein [Alphaproteobacteria bacterium]